MKPESTNRTTENTNNQQKKVVSRGGINLGDADLVSSYYSYSDFADIKYQITDNNNYSFDAFLNAKISADGYLLYPANQCIVSVPTGTIHTAGQLYIYSGIDDIGGGQLGNILSIATTRVTQTESFGDWISYYLIYSTRITEGTIL